MYSTAGAARESGDLIFLLLLQQIAVKWSRVEQGSPHDGIDVARWYELNRGTQAQRKDYEARNRCWL